MYHSAAWCTFIMELNLSDNFLHKITVGPASAGIPPNVKRELNQ